MSHEFFDLSKSLSLTSKSYCIKNECITKYEEKKYKCFQKFYTSFKRALATFRLICISEQAKNWEKNHFQSVFQFTEKTSFMAHLHLIEPEDVLQNAMKKIQICFPRSSSSPSDTPPFSTLSPQNSEETLQVAENIKLTCELLEKNDFGYQLKFTLSIS